MNKFKDWIGANIISKGANAFHERATLLKAVVKLSVVGIAISQSNLVEIYKNKDDSGPYKFSDVRELISGDSVRLNSIYGSDNQIFVFNDDEHLRKIVQNIDDKEFKEYKSDNMFTYASTLLYRSLRDFVGLEISDQDINKQAFASDMNSFFVGPFASKVSFDEKGENGEDLSLVFVKKDFGSLTEGLDVSLESRFPYKIDKSIQQSYAFFHELAHGIDTDANKGYKKHIQLQRESVADVAFSLIAMRETGSNDIYENVIRPFRLSNAKDIIHMTVEISDVALSMVDIGQLKGKTDVELMKYAQVLVNDSTTLMSENSHVTSEGKKFNDFTFMMNKFTAYAIKDKESYQMALSNLDKMTEGGGKETIMDLSRVAMSASLQNLVYTSSFDEHKSAYVDSIERHIKYWQDDLARDALFIAKESGEFDYGKFAKEMGFSIVENSHKKDAQFAAIHSYYDSVMGRPTSDVQLSSIPNHLGNGFFEKLPRFNSPEYSK